MARYRKSHSFYPGTAIDGGHLDFELISLEESSDSVIAYSPDGTETIEMSHDGTDAQFVSSTGDIKLSPAGDCIITDGSRLYIYNSGNGKQTNLYHGTNDFNIDTSSGDIVLDPAGNDVLLSNANLRVYDAGNVFVYDSDNSDYVNLEHTNSGGKLNSVNGYLWLKSGNNAVYFDSGRDSGSTTTHFYWRDTDETQIMYLDSSSAYNWLRIGGNDGCDGVFLAYSAGKDKYIQMYHNDTDGYINTNNGDLRFGATGHIYLSPGGSGNIYLTTPYILPSDGCDIGDGSHGIQVVVWNPQGANPAATEGKMYIYQSGSTYQIRCYVNGGWRSAALT